MSFDSAVLPAGTAPSVSGRLDPSWRLVAASVVIAFVVALAAFTVTVRSSPGLLVWSDGLAYFLYARSAVVDRDLDITDEFEDLDPKFPPDSKAMEPLRKWSLRNPDGSLQPPWPLGSGLVMTPFYAAGYAVERIAAAIADRPVDTYGLIPQYGFAMGSVAFGLLGFWCLFWVCRELSGRGVAYVASLAVVLCGPVVFFTFFHPSMAHASSFGIAALLTAVWLRSWQNGASVTSMLALGLLLGLATTVRYQNSVFGIMLAALGLKELAHNGLRVAIGHAAVGLVAFAAPVVMLLGSQLSVSGASKHASLSVANYPIDFASPYFFDVLLSCRHGTFYWAPVLGLGLLGLLWAVRRRQGWALVLLITLAAHTYLIGGLGLSNVAYADRPPSLGWLKHWDNAPSFGMRYLTECAVMFAPGLACLIQATRRYATASVWLVALLPFAIWNGLLILAYGLSTIDRSGCLPYTQMLSGIGTALRRLLAL